MSSAVNTFHTVLFSKAHFVAKFLYISVTSPGPPIEVYSWGYIVNIAFALHQAYGHHA